MPGTPGQYSVDACRAWIELNVDSTKDGADDIELSELAEAQKRAEYAKTLEELRYKKLKNDQVEGQLLDRDQVFREVTAMIVQLRSRFMAIPKRLAVLVPGPLKAPVTKAAEKAIRSVLREAFSAHLIDCSVEDMIIQEGERIARERRATG